MVNITQFNFSDKEFSSLCNNYWRILIILCWIDWNISNNEKNFLLSIISRTWFDWENKILSSINHHIEDRLISTKNINYKHDHIRLFILENVIFLN